MQIEAVRYSDDQQIEWDNFIEINKRNATFLHSRKFFNHNALNKIDDASFLFYKKKKLIAVLPASLYKQHNKIIYHSHPRSTYGGFVINEKVGIEEAIEIVEATIKFAKSKSADEIIIRNPFRIFHQSPSDETDYAMWFHGFKIKYREIESTIILEENYETKYENGAKYNIKKARKSLSVKETTDYESFWKLLCDNLTLKHNAIPTHTLEQFIYLKNLVGDDKIKLFGGFIDNKLICGVIIFICKPMAINAQYIAVDSEHQDIRPLNAVVDHIINWAWQNSFKYFNLGGATEEMGSKINYGLIHFKEGFGGKVVLRETMHLLLN